MGSSVENAWRRRGAAALALALLPIMGACSSQQPPSSKDGTVTLHMWNDYAPTKNWLNEVLKGFEAAHPKIHVDVTDTPGPGTNGFATLLKSAEVAQTTPDVTTLFAGGMVLQNKGFLLPLDKYVTPAFKGSLMGDGGTGWRFASDAFRKDGTIYGVPYGAGNYYFVYYNKSLFKKANIADADLPKTWEDLVALAKKFKEQGITPFAFGEKNGHFGAWTQDALLSGGLGTDGLVDAFFGRVHLNSPLVVKSYQAWHDLFSAGLTNQDAPALDDGQGIAAFAGGKSAMTITGPFEDVGMNVGPMKGNVGLFPVPVFADAKYPKVLSGGSNNDYVVFKNSAHPQEAMELIKWLVSQKSQQLALEAGFGQLPNNTGYRVDETVRKVDPLLADAFKYIGDPNYTLAEAFDNVMPGTVCTYWYRTNSGVFTGSLSPDAAATSLGANMDSYLAQGH